MKILPTALTGLIFILGLTSLAASAGGEVNLKTVAVLYHDKATLVGKTVVVQGKVVKVNNGIMGRNWIHVQDGTGDAKSNDLVVTSQQTANVLDHVTVSGVVAINQDFGAGYAYPLLIQNATIVVKK
ncbi:MAG: hypothetical protein ACHP7O_06395 [Burkholderiales bacterium]